MRRAPFLPARRPSQLWLVHSAGDSHFLALARTSKTCCALFKPRRHSQGRFILGNVGLPDRPDRLPRKQKTRHLAERHVTGRW
jgi:hypothetical protein